MFAKLKKKIAEEAATAPRTGVRMPRSCSKESITSVGADSGDDFVSTSFVTSLREGLCPCQSSFEPTKSSWSHDTKHNHTRLFSLKKFSTAIL